jgi:hypothetical protein
MDNTQSHVQIEKQAAVPVAPVAPSPNPFLNPGAAKEYGQSAYKL